MKNYLIIGGSTGIGLSLSDQLSKQGHRVYATYRNTEVTSSDISYHHLDISQEAFSLDFLPDTLDGVAYCPGSINLLPFARIKPTAFVEDYQLQVVGAVKVLQAVLPRLKKSSSASVVLFSTVAVQAGFPFHAQVSASKGAIEGLTRALAAELAPMIRVNAIAPTITDTPLAGRILSTEDKKEANAQRHPLKRVGSAEQVATMTSFLLSDDSLLISGKVLSLDAGMANLRV